MAQRDMANILSGPCSISLGGVDLGHTVGESRLTVRPNYREVKADTSGDDIVDYIRMGTSVRLNVRVAEWTLAGLQKIFPLGVSEDDYLAIGPEPGAKLSDYAEPMRLHPLELDEEDDSLDIVFWKAVAVGEVSVVFSRKEDRVFDAVFSIFSDGTKDAGERIGRIGAQ